KILPDTPETLSVYSHLPGGNRAPESIGELDQLPTRREGLHHGLDELNTVGRRKIAEGQAGDHARYLFFGFVGQDSAGMKGVTASDADVREVPPKMSRHGGVAFHDYQAIWMNTTLK